MTDIFPALCGKGFSDFEEFLKKVLTMGGTHDMI
jgi:hypothetical protein